MATKKRKHVEAAVEQFLEAGKAIEVVPSIEEQQAEKANARAADPILLTPEQQVEYSQIKTVSARIRYLHAQGFATKQIAPFIDKRYQHVRNVLTTPLKRVQKVAEEQ